MSTGVMIIAAALVVIDLVVCMVIAYRTKNSSVNSKDFFIAGKKTGTILLTLTAWASFSGAGNFIGQAGRGALYGIDAYWLWLGEGLLGGIAVGALLAPYLARFSYVSMPHYISHYLCGGDAYVRKAGAVAALMPNVVWPGAQIMGISYVMDLLFGVDYRLSVIVCGIVLISHTAAGGLKSVILADAYHGVVQMVFALSVIVFGLASFNFDPGLLQSRIMFIDPNHWNLLAENPMAIATSFFTGFVGAASNPIFWNRAFAAKDVSTARKAYGVTFFFNIVLVFAIIAIGISAFTYNPEIGDQALVWLILNEMPPFVGMLLAAGVFAACISTADTHLNCAAANIVSDIIDPDSKLSPEISVKYARLATVVAGTVSIACAFFGDYIYALGVYGYTVCGGVLMPVFVIGLMLRNRKAEHYESKLDVRAAKIGISVGIIVAIAFEVIPMWASLLGGGVIPAIVATSFGMVIPNALYRGKQKKMIAGAGNDDSLPEPDESSGEKVHAPNGRG